MKKVFEIKALILCILVLYPSVNSFACDACGCFTGLNAEGILPQFQKNFVGYRFLTTRFHHPQKVSSYSHLGQVTHDEIYIQQLWGRWYPHDRIPLFVNIPYKQHMRVAESRSESLQGIGDISIKLFYQLVRPNDTLKKPIKNLLMIGGGIQLPTGKYQQRDGSKKLYPMGFQLGSGAFLYELRAIYTVRYKSFGLNTEMYSMYAEENELEYRLGSSNGIGSSLFVWLQRSNIVWMPFIAIGFDRISKDSEYGRLVSGTGGDFQRYTVGIDFYWRSWVLSAATDQVIALDIPDSAPKPGPMFRAGVLKNF